MKNLELLHPVNEREKKLTAFDILLVKKKKLKIRIFWHRMKLEKKYFFLKKIG